MDKVQKAQEEIKLIPKESAISLLKRLVKNNPVEVLKIQSDVKLSTAINGTALATLKRHNELETQEALTNLVARLANSFNIGEKNLSNEQVIEIVYLLIERYYYLKLEELILIFKKAKFGEYGKNYHRLDVQVIFEWIELYYSSEERAVLLEKEAKNYKETEKQKYELSEEAREHLQKIIISIPVSEAIKEKRTSTPYNENDFLKDIIENAPFLEKSALNKLIKECQMYKQDRALKILLIEKQKRKE